MIIYVYISICMLRMLCMLRILYMSISIYIDLYSIPITYYLLLITYESMAWPCIKQPVSYYP